MLGHYKAPLHRFFDPVTRLLLRVGARPNHLTVLGLGVSVTAAYVFSLGRLRWGAVLLAVAALFDFFDGAVARLAGSESDYGAFLDSVVDRYSDVAILFGILVYYQQRGDTVGSVLTMATRRNPMITTQGTRLSTACAATSDDRAPRVPSLSSRSSLPPAHARHGLPAVLTNVTPSSDRLHRCRILDTALR
jgi:hypothetical protein